MQVGLSFNYIFYIILKNVRSVYVSWTSQYIISILERKSELNEYLNEKRIRSAVIASVSHT